MNIRKQTAAGKFYTDDREELSNHFAAFQKNSFRDYEYTTRAVIVPHAGYIYSGQLAYEGFQYLDKKAKNVFIFAPPHYIPVKNIALSIFDRWETPFGEISVNQKINQDLVKEFQCEFQDDAFENEHSIEVQIPFVQKMFSNVKIIPILVGNHYEKAAKIIKHYWDDEENVFVISSDLSHFLNSSQARKIDGITAQMIESGSSEGFESEQACGSSGICALLDFVSEKKYSLIRVGLVNSGDVTGESSSVVGYGSWILYGGEKNQFLKKYFREFIINACKESIEAGFSNSKPEFERVAPIFNQLGACFVTLEKNGGLRGCMGSIIAHRPLMSDLVENAQNAAFYDPRFTPLNKSEFEQLKIDVSLLSEPQKIDFESEKGLLEEIQPNKDGIIIKERGYQAVYLPSVWEQLPEKEMFLASLRLKAGLPADYFSQTLEAYRFTTEMISM